ncbi:MAG: ferrous iron transporter B [Candidatus Omnitrophica bacterium]|nr:ferrous iron transporter B [Candidatus Omnitrophota bacterium]
MKEQVEISDLLTRADLFRQEIGETVHDQITASTYAEAERVTSRAVVCEERHGVEWEEILDRLITSRATGIPFMILLLAGVFWITIQGANVPSEILAGLLMTQGGLTEFAREHFGAGHVPWFLGVSLYELLSGFMAGIHAPSWLTGFLVDGVYLALAWVVSVMLPPMAIFFPLFTILEDLGLLPRIAFNMDRFFRAVGAHGKQALTMAMGFGCNAAGVVACRIIDSPRERLIAILTNNFVPCNGRWPMLIMVSSLFVAAAFPPSLASLVSVGAVTAVTLIGVAATLGVSFLLSRTLLKGVASSFTLEMPPYRKPNFGRVIYTSIIDRTLFVLWRAAICSAPAGGLIWLLGAIHVGDVSAFSWLRGWLDPFGHAIGLDGVILIAFLFAIPANEIVVPTIIMGYMNGHKMMELSDPSALFAANGWTLLTAICLLLFSLLHYPCTTTTLTIWRETRSLKWTILSNLIPLTIAILTCGAIAQTARFMGWA